MEEAKHMALLFFMDHLMQKNGRRTIHDLSCQFGARGFTEEMRQAVGTTQEGLTDFLNSHPSLFSVDGDQVILNGYGEMTAKNNPLLQSASRNRDYEREAVLFFENKLTKFGPELQIKSLLGHRSQAAPEVRLVSGRHLKDFCEFLQAQTEHFVVEGDRVRLKNMPEPSTATIELDDEGKPLAGVKAKQAAVDFLKGVLEQNEEQPIPLDAFYQRFCERFAHTIRQDVATNPKELLQFLKLNRNIFFIRSNKVSLVKNRASEDGSENGSLDEQEQENNNNLFPLDQNSLNRVHVVKALRPAQEAVEKIWSDVNAAERKVVGVDFKTVSVANDGEVFLSLGILATTSQIVVFDLTLSDVLLLESGLKEILESDKVLKVMHDARRVSSLLAHRYAVNLRHVFDTQVAHAVLQHEKFGKALHETSWAQRPLGPDLLLAAVEEAHCLVCALYQQLNALIPVHLRAMFEERCVEALLASPHRPPPLAPNNTATNSPYCRRPTAPMTATAAPFVPAAAASVASSTPKQTCEASTQTFSTGDIQVLNVYYE